MKIKELQKTVNVAWSPNQQNPILLAAGTSAQQLDASFSTNATLELYSLNLTDPGYEMALKGAVKSAHRFNKLVWSPHGMGNTHLNGLIVGACENGVLQLYSAAKLLHGEEALIGQQAKHKSSILSIDFNEFQPNLLATGASEAELLIWDLNNINTPMTPGTAITPSEDVGGIHWNKQVQHVLATVLPSKCVIWDLRKNEPIIKLHDTQSRVRWRPAQWNPTVATQIWLASEEDSAPTVQLWDLRFATAPSKTIQVHQRGVLGLTWCARDTDLMISCGKDNKILCWNPNAESQENEILAEIATTSQWCFDVSWCPRNPALISGCSFDGTVSIYSLFGGSVVSAQTTSKIADSFPGMDTSLQAPVPQPVAQHVANDLKKPPKWLRRPVGASFGFGGKLVSFNEKDRKITISQVVTNMELVERSTQLEEALAQGNYIDFCRKKADQSTDQHSRYLWYFVKANFEQNPQAEMLNLLGYRPDDITAKFNQFITNKPDEDNAVDNLSLQLNQSSLDGSLQPHQQAQSQKPIKPKEPLKLHTGDDSDGLICEALLTGNIEAAVDLCMSAGRTTDAIILAMTGGPELLGRTQYRYLRDNDNYISSVISALVTRDWQEIVSNCSLDSWKEALVAILTHGNNELSPLCEKLGKRLCSENGGDVEMAKSALLCYVCSGSLEPLVEAWSTVQSSKPNTPKKQSPTQSKNIQELVEIIMLLQKAAEIRGNSFEICGKVAEVLSQYALLLATQGSLSSALTYLCPSLDPELVELKDRLYYALGHKQINQQRTSNAYSHQPTNRYAQPRQSISNTIPAPSSVPQPIGGNVPVASPYFTPQQPPSIPGSSWNTIGTSMQSNNYNPTPLLNPPPVGPPPIDSQPPRPSSVNSQHGGSSNPLTSRAKYVLDPSVRSGSMYGQTGSNNFYGGQDYSSTSANSPFSGPIPPTPQYNQFNTNPVGAAPGQVNQFQAFSPTPQQQMQAPNVEMNQSSMIQPQRNPTPPPGWNDPPPMTGRKSRNQRQDVSAVAPITHPLFGADPNQNVQQQTNGYHQQDPYGQGSAPGFYNPMQQQPPTLTTGQVNQTNFQQNFQNYGAGQPTTQPLNPINNTKSPEPAKEKAPLPEEFIYLQTVLDELRKQCINSATNPQTKRKLDDVGKRLEQLYDLLRENRLSPNTLAQLNQLVQLVQIGDYTNSIGLHTQMACGPDFATIASFMPGVKVLLQTAMQHQVYLR